MTAPSSNARKHESGNPLLRAVLGHFTRTVCRVVAERRPRSVFDVGCGEGYMLSALRKTGIDAALFGIDHNPAAITAARTRLGDGATLEVGDARLLAPGRRHDVVMMLEVLEHLDDPTPMLDVLDALSCGHVVLSVPHEPLFRGLNLLRGHHIARWGNHPEHVGQFSRREFLDFVHLRFDVVAAPWVPPWTLVVARARSRYPVPT